MLCDKCHKKILEEHSWLPNESVPRYTIEEKSVLIGGSVAIHLCYECSRRFRKWLNEKPQKED